MPYSQIEEWPALLQNRALLSVVVKIAVTMQRIRSIFN